MTGPAAFTHPERPRMRRGAWRLSAVPVVLAALFALAWALLGGQPTGGTGEANPPAGAPSTTAAFVYGVHVNHVQDARVGHLVEAAVVYAPSHGGAEFLDRASSLDTGFGVAAETAADATSVARGGVYSLRDEAGQVVRTGRTNDLAAREAAHARDPVLGDFEFQVEYRTDVYAEQRGLEQVLYDRYPGAQAANGGFNKIRGISPTNPNLPAYMRAAQDFLDGLG